MSEISKINGLFDTKQESRERRGRVRADTTWAAGSLGARGASLGGGTVQIGRVRKDRCALSRHNLGCCSLRAGWGGEGMRAGVDGDHGE